MAELDRAQRRLTEALRRLETVLSKRLSGLPPDTDVERAFHQIQSERDALARDVAVLRSECDRLSVALREAEQENRSMRETTDAVVRRLDGSISELDRMLEG